MRADRIQLHSKGMGDIHQEYYVHCLFRLSIIGIEVIPKWHLSIVFVAQRRIPNCSVRVHGFPFELELRLW